MSVLYAVSFFLSEAVRWSWLAAQFISLVMGVWALIGFGCVIAEVGGTSRGPAEWALRWLVAKTARPLPLPALALAFPVAPVGAGGQCRD